VLDAIAADPRLTARQRSALREVYESFVAASHVPKAALVVTAALVTGAASGIGQAVTERLERDGLDVLSVDLRPDPDGPGTPTKPT
jgi:hypothetical protein